MQKILVLRGGALGDFIVALPALALLRRRWPAARIELAGNAAAAAVACESGLIDAAHSQQEARWSALFAAAPLPPTFAAWLAEFDLVMNFWPDPDRTLRRHFPPRDGQTFLSGDAWPTRTPAAAHYCEPLRPWGLTTHDFFHRLASPVAGASIIAVHPGSGSPRKNWPIERWARLCGWLQHECHTNLLVVTGEADWREADALAGFGRSARNLPLRELVAQFGSCRLFLGHDSGVSHLAAACGVPSVLLFGPTDAAMWAPPAPHVHVLRRGTELSAISLEDVQAAVTALW